MHARRALEAGRALPAEYADAAAKPRMAHFMKKAKQRARRSSPPVSAPEDVMVAGNNGTTMSIPAHCLCASRFWDPVQFQAWQYSLWLTSKEGQVDAGNVQQVQAPAD